MVQFGAMLLQVRREDWKGYYIDYNGLKAQLRQLRNSYNEASEAAQGGEEYHHAETAGRVSSPMLLSGSRGSLVEQGSNKPLKRRFASYSLVVGGDVEELEEKFSATLDSEVEKVVLFFLAKQGDLADRLLGARRDQVGWKTCGSPGQRDGAGKERKTESWSSDYYCSSKPEGTVQAVYCSIGREIAELMRFLQLNVSGLRKILKKHDKQVRDKLIATNYLSTRAQEKYSLMRQLYNNEGIMALVASLRNAFEEFEPRRLPSGTDTMRMTESTLKSRGMALLDDESRPSFETDELGLSDSRVSLKHSMRLTRASRRSPSEISATAGVLQEIASAQRELAEAQHRTISQYLSLQVLLDGSGLASFDDVVEIDDKRELHRTSALINLASTFLYMVNYYIVGPTSAEYAEALGGSPAASGLIIGMTPIASCFSCLVYSWWTNRSFRQPLLVCGGMLTVGNFLYGLALSFDSFWMVLVGRALIGLGGARGVNRRYIADTIPIESRTAYSAAFVAAGSVGMAFGPFLSAMTNEVDFTAFGMIFNGLTNPGWVMFALWTIMGVVVYMEFQEPRRSDVTVGCDEQTPAKDTPKRVSTSATSLTDKGTSGGGGKYGSTVALETSGGYGGGRSNSAVVSDMESGTIEADDVAEGAGSTSSAAVAVTEKPGVEENSALLPRPIGGITTTTAIAVDSTATASTNVAAVVEAGTGTPLTTTKEHGEEDADDGSSGLGEGREAKFECSLGAITLPLGSCLFGYFVNKLITEMAVSSAPVLTQYMFDWSAMRVGWMMSILGLVVLPINATVGYLSQVYEDRFLLQVLAVFAGLGCLLTIDFSWAPFEFTQWQYMVGVGLTFVAMQAHEGVVMSITSKIIPAELARGTWNSGFLATEAGTFGRFVGDALITTMGVMTMSSLDFLLFFPSVILVGLMMLCFSRVYPFLQGE